jgi:hypothetical protein
MAAFVPGRRRRLDAAALRLARWPAAAPIPSYPRPPAEAYIYNRAARPRHETQQHLHLSSALHCPPLHHAGHGGRGPARPGPARPGPDRPATGPHAAPRQLSSHQTAPGCAAQAHSPFLGEGGMRGGGGMRGRRWPRARVLCSQPLPRPARPDTLPPSAAPARGPHLRSESLRCVCVGGQAVRFGCPMTGWV